ncbi:NAD(P)-dependent oxidoreductase [Granulicella arctica]|uniref:Putative NADH-flavin reductase n=1 Tax=Granulicella arctica TaxID=940613 RepID=A0A7Y9PGA8_9BACT|nr:NAD(P)H-binding protein [Granulicella arctica]NYF78621.1 putative NADH-flavin reductase [Granulicella arctica]
MRIAIFGASGTTGQLLTERCLAAGYGVTALLRTPETFPLKASVRTLQGSIFDPTAIADTLEGSDAVLSALGARSLRKEDILERAIPLITAAMQGQGPQRIIALGSAGALPTSLDKQPAWRRWIVQHLVYTTVLKYPIASQIAQYATLSASPLDWTMPMPPMLTNTPARGTYRIDPEALPRNGSRISRADVADFMIAQLTTSQWSRRGVYLSW